MICASSHTQDVIPPADVLIVQVNWAAKALVVQQSAQRRQAQVGIITDDRGTDGKADVEEQGRCCDILPQKALKGPRNYALAQVKLGKV